MDACLMLADTSFVDLVLGILKVGAALGFVIFVHELGHFAVAKMCGVQCDKFFVGFDIGGYKLSRKWGETEYGIGILPLGGYVRMLGQNDDPSKIAEQLKESEAAAQDIDESQTKEITGPGGEKYRVDRRSYMAKSVPQRMAIISAGVIMNIIFGFIFAVIAFSIGADYIPCVVGGVSPASPAYMANLEPGDEFLKLNDRQEPSFGHLRQDVMLGDRDQGVTCVVKKAATGDEVELQLKPAVVKGVGMQIGISPSATNTLFADDPVAKGSTAAAAEGFQGGDKIVEINGAPVETYRDLKVQLFANLGKPLDVMVERPSESAGSDAPVTEVVTVQPAKIRRLGVQVTMGDVTAVQPGSPADDAGIEPGDRITSINGRPVGPAEPGEASWDPSTLPNRLPQEEGELELVLQRGDQTINATITQSEGRWFESPNGPGAPFALSTVGLTYQVSTEVAATVEGATGAEPLRVGDIITSIVVAPPKGGESDLESTTINFSEDSPNWPFFFTLMQAAPLDSEIVLTVKRNDKPVELKQTLSEQDGVFYPNPGLNLKTLVLTRPAESFGQALSLASDRVWSDMTSVFRVLGKIGSDQVPVKNVSGPLGILSVAYKSAEAGWSQLLLFLVLLSVNLAVLNFLPIPVLDGGHMVFLAWEGLTGKPANERVVVALHTVGFLMLIGLMVFAFSNDIRNMFGGQSF
ncbi:Regulator of sigma-E protease RseP [Posidoniimonas corsicana]|uniref:Regulator of sigma-E protease RseP n=1 Tax=Posidoniimonas corsicana TaxID=1938618 RepID=A0A5C5VH49_9BACT|nr:site-2 protease family protein [Posidoniimonas corsicana]TWT37280.1 Regulator of sigma-E protease RseP [Posidoniimonas corsicana]